MLYLEILPKNQKELFDFFYKQEWISEFYLAGGTSLALQIGHRQSIDFDFFTSNEFDKHYIITELEKFNKFIFLSESVNILDGQVNKVRISFFKYSYKLLKEPIRYGNINIANKLDIAAIKLEAISGRGSRKDFTDFFYLLKEFSIEEIFTAYQEKYGLALSNHHHLQKSLVYFEDAEKYPPVKTKDNISWIEIKKFITNTVIEYFNKNRY